MQASFDVARDEEVVRTDITPDEDSTAIDMVPKALQESFDAAHDMKEDQIGSYMPMILTESSIHARGQVLDINTQLVTNIPCEDPVFEFVAKFGHTDGSFPFLPSNKKNKRKKFLPSFPIRADDAVLGAATDDELDTAQVVDPTWGSLQGIIDDLLATGGTAEAACKLVDRLGAEVAGCLFVIELTYLKGRARLVNRDVLSLVGY